MICTYQVADIIVAFWYAAKLQRRKSEVIEEEMFDEDIKTSDV